MGDVTELQPANKAKAAPDEAEQNPYSKQVIDLCKLIGPRFRGMTDQGHTVLDSSIRELAADIAQGLERPLLAEGLTRCLAHRHVGVTPQDWMVLRGGIDDIARAVMHAIADPTSEGRVLLVQQPPPFAKH